MFLDTRNNMMNEGDFESAPYDELFTTKRAAKYLGFETNTLAVWRSNGRHNLKFVRIGRSVRYRKSELDRFLDEGMKPE